MQLHQTKFWENPSLDRLLWIPWGLNYFSSWAISNFCPQICQITLGFPCLGLSLSLSGISLEKTLFFASAMFVLFLAIIWQCCSLTFSSERFENHFFFSFFPPRTLCRLSGSSQHKARMARNIMNQKTNKKVHDISCYSCLTLSVLVDRTGNLTQQLAGEWIRSSFTNIHLSVTAIIIQFYTL